MIVPLVRGMVSFGVNMFIEVDMIVLVVAFIALEGVASAPYAIEWRATVMAEETGFSDARGIGASRLADVDDETTWVTSMTALVPTLASSEEVLLFGCEACSCWPTAIWNCRALQPRMPSYHV